MNFEDFDAKVKYTLRGGIMGQMKIKSDLPKFNGENPHLDVGTATLRHEEPLNVNIINVDGWLTETWNENLPNEIELSNGSSFFVRWDSSHITVSASENELLTAARQRASEDRTHASYVLGGWTYLARKAKHVDPQTVETFRDAFDLSLKECNDVPSDATTEQYRGGA